MDEVGLGLRLQQARKTAGLTQQQLCQEASLSYSTLAKIERGAIKSPSIFTIRQIANALGTSIDELLGLESPAPARPSLKKRSKSGIEFVYFDINGCLVRFYQRAFARVAEDTGVPSDIVETIFWHYDDATCRGDITVAELNTTLAKRFNVSQFDWEKYYLEAVEPIAESQELLRWVSEHYKFGLLSNIMPGFINAMKRSGQLPDIAYDQIVESSDVHAIKPDPNIYQIATERAGVAPESILFVDDSRINLVSAEKIGWRTLSFDVYRPKESTQRIKDALEF